MFRFISAAFLVLSLLSSASSQQVNAPAPGSDTTIRITVNLIQLDAVVTDSKGRQVTDLKKEDFQALQDGHPQQITNVTYISNESAPSARTILTTSPSQPAAPLLRREDVRRTIAIVVDDLGLSFESTARVRAAVHKYIDNQVQPGDMVAIICTGRGIGVNQQFTSDKNILRASADSIRFNLMNRIGMFSLSPTSVRDNGAGPTVQTPQGDYDQREFRQQHYTVGTLGALQWVIRGVRDMPGRKSVVLFSEDLQLFAGGTTSTLVNDMIHKVTDAANRSSVVFYVIDPRGLVPLGPSADAAGMPSMNQQASALWASQDGMHVLADETGGIFVRNNNDLNDGLQQVMNDQKGYYLIGYKPDASTFDPQHLEARFHNFKLRLRPGLKGLKIRSRAGFYGVTDDRMREITKTREQMLAEALFSPFGAKDIRVRLTLLFANREKIGSYVKTLLHVDARDLKFEHSDGKHKAKLEVVMATFGQDGRPEDMTHRSLPIELNDADYQASLDRGLLFALAHKVKNGGAYQYRAVIRDTTANTLGSANEFIEVPNLKKKRLALSGVILRAVGSTATPPVVAGEAEIPGDGWSSRSFEPGTKLAYAYEVMNLKRDPAQKPHLQAQIKIAREGKQVFESKPASVGTVEGDQSRYFEVQGEFRLGANMRPGSYVLQLLVRDELAPQDHQLATQSVDFEIKP